MGDALLHSLQADAPKAHAPPAGATATTCDGKFYPHLVAAQGSTEAQLLAFYGELNRWDLRFTAAYFDHSGLYAYDQ